MCGVWNVERHHELVSGANAAYFDSGTCPE